MAHDVFISYSSKDRTVADPLCAHLEEQGIGCWIAPRNIVPGSEWSEAIIDGINACRVVVLIFSANANNSPQVLREVERAVSKRIPIIPFRIEEVALSRAMEYFISVPHWLDAIAPPLETHLETLRRTVQRLLASGAGEALTISPPPFAAPDPTVRLPAQVTAFVGRAQEMAAVHGLLDGGARLVTLTGAGGSGKTRLALQVATDRAARYPGGVWWADLAPVREADQVLRAVAAELAIKETPGTALTQQIAEHLRDREALLVLDNFEQVTGAAGDLSEVIRLCPRLTALVTSRAVLNLSFEQEYAVPCLGRDEAARLFALRAQQARSGFTLDEQTRPAVESLCRRLEGIPLALELAAAQVRMLNVAQIEKQLTQRFRVLVSPFGDVNQRQRTLRAAVDWSYDLLSDDEKTLFAALSRFVGGFTLEAAEAVCAREDLFFGVLRLREQSLLTTEDTGVMPRFLMLETLREYGQEKLRSGGPWEAVAERHARYYAGMAAREGPRFLEAGADEDALTSLTDEADNLRVGWEWLLENGSAEEAADMTVALTGFWERAGWFAEGRAALERCRAREPEIQDEGIRARLLGAVGWFAHLNGDNDAAAAHQERSLVLFRAREDTEGESVALNNLALIAQARGETRRAGALLAESLALARSLGDSQKQAVRLSNLGLLAIGEGQWDRAREHLEEARSLYQRSHDRFGAAVCLCNLGDLALQRKDWEEAASLSEQSLRLFREMKDRRGIAYTLANRADALARQGDHDTALSSAREALTISLESGMRGLVPLVLEIAARSRAAREGARDALLLLAAAQTLRAEINTPRSPEEQADAGALEAELAAALGETMVRALRSRAEDLSAEAIVREVFEKKGEPS